MFNIFKKKKAGIKITDLVYISEEAKYKAMFSLWSNDKNTAFVFWFEESLHKAEQFFSDHSNEPISLLHTREASRAKPTGKKLLFAEHYPLRSKEEEVFVKLNLESATVYSSMKEPLLQKFGGDKIADMMKKLGMKDDEAIEHSMVSKAIRNAQEKIEKKLEIEQTARSQDDWFEKNYTS